VVPKHPVRNILDAPQSVLAPLIYMTQKVAIAAKEAFDADGVTVTQFSESAGGQVVFHLHFHVIPRYEGVALRSRGVMGDSALLAAHAEKLKAAMA